MVLLTTTPRILKAMSSLTDICDLETSLPSKPGDPIPHHTLVTLSKQCHTSLNTLLRGTALYRPPPPVKSPPTPEYLALMFRLRAAEEQKTYTALLAQQARDERRALYGHADPSDEGTEDNISPSLVLNILLSVVMCAVATFQITKWWAGGNDGVRVLMSLGTGIVVGVAEVGVYAGYLRKVGEAKAKERKLRERKEVVGEYLGDGKGVDARGMDVDVDIAGKIESMNGEDGQKIEIWGKGVNGGMRRRVKERWEKEQEKEKFPES